MTLYTQVSSNRNKTWVYLSVYVALIWAIGWGASYYFDSSAVFLFAVMVSVIQGWVAYFHSDTIALLTARAIPLDQNQFGNVYKIVENLSITSGLPMPKLYLINDTALNAFATGRDPKHSSIAVTLGAIQQLDDNELAGVLAHELSHVGNEDIRLMSLVMVMAGLIALISDIMLRSMWFGGGRRRDNNGEGGAILMVIAIALAILAPVAAALIQLAISRKREFMADANGVLLTRYPEGLISALKKIGGDEEPLEVANKGSAHMYFANPLHGRMWFASLFDTHPPIEKRIEALQKGSGMHL
ncbi:MAG: M48 family metallopeptidase [bacterium]